jgi:hypothetical protein
MALKSSARRAGAITSVTLAIVLTGGGVAFAGLPLPSPSLPVPTPSVSLPPLPTPSSSSSPVPLPSTSALPLPSPVSSIVNQLLGSSKTPTGTHPKTNDGSPSGSPTGSPGTTGHNAGSRTGRRTSAASAAAGFPVVGFHYGSVFSGGSAAALDPFVAPPAVQQISLANGSAPDVAALQTSTPRAGGLFAHGLAGLPGLLVILATAIVGAVAAAHVHELQRRLAAARA